MSLLTLHLVNLLLEKINVVNGVYEGEMIGIFPELCL